MWRRGASMSRRRRRAREAESGAAGEGRSKGGRRWSTKRQRRRRRGRRRSSLAGWLSEIWLDGSKLLLLPRFRCSSATPRWPPLPEEQLAAGVRRWPIRSEMTSLCCCETSSYRGFPGACPCVCRSGMMTMRKTHA